jgi:hypothetical protein
MKSISSANEEAMSKAMLDTLRSDLCTGGRRKRQADAKLVLRICEAMLDVEAEGKIDKTTARKKVAKFVGTALWTNLLVRMILLPLANNLILFIWDRYLERKFNG